MRVLLKRSYVAGAVPNSNDLTQGEVAINLGDGKIYTKNISDQIIEIGGNSPTSIPAGTIISAIPGALSSTEWLPCNGSVYTSDNYQELASILGPATTSTFIQGNGIAVNWNLRGCASNGTTAAVIAYNANSFFYTSNGTNWSRVQPITNGYYSGLAWNNNAGLFFGISTSQGVYFTTTVKSTNGSSWIYEYAIPQSSNLTNSVNGNNGICIISSGNRSLITSDGIIFQSGKLPAWANWQAIGWNGTVFVAIAYGSNIAATSSDGITWIQRTMPATANWKSVTWNGSTFCAIAYASNIAATSPDGITWTQRTMSSSRNWQAISSNGTIFCAIAVGTNIVATSSDGITWSESTMPISSDWSDIIWNGSLFCAVRSNGGTSSVATSSDGITWTTRTTPNAAFTKVNWNGSVFSIVSTTTVAATSSDGITWTQRANTFNLSRTFLGWTGSVFVAGGNNVLCSTSSDGITWTSRYHGASTGYNDIVSDNIKFVVVPTSGINGWYSNDGVSWTEMYMPTYANWAYVKWNGTMFCAVASSSNIAAISSDGINWNLITLPVTSNWGCMSVFKNNFIVLSSNQSIALYSSDNGLNWSVYNLPSVGNYIVSIATSNFVIGLCTGSSKFVYSIDGINWIEKVIPNNFLYNYPAAATLNNSENIFSIGAASTTSSGVMYSSDTSSFSTPYITTNTSGFTNGNSSGNYYIKV